MVQGERNCGFGERDLGEAAVHGGEVSCFLCSKREFPLLDLMLASSQQKTSLSSENLKIEGGRKALTT